MKNLATTGAKLAFTAVVTILVQSIVKNAIKK
jgi:hypothetical protein